MTAMPKGRYCVLVVEDNAAEALLIEEAFSSISIPVDLECVSTGAEARARLSKDSSARRPTLVLVDNHLPDIRGTDLANILATDPQYGHPRVVLLSGDLVRDRKGSWEDWLEKPASWQQWEVLARDLLQRFLIGSQHNA
jgi:CheY-like chemotaxis protein